MEGRPAVLWEITYSSTGVSSSVGRRQGRRFGQGRRIPKGAKSTGWGVKPYTRLRFLFPPVFSRIFSSPRSPPAIVPLVASGAPSPWTLTSRASTQGRVTSNLVLVFSGTPPLGAQRRDQRKSSSIGDLRRPLLGPVFLTVPGRRVVSTLGPWFHTKFLISNTVIFGDFR